LDINGNNRYLFEDCHYLGVDLGEGENVDIVSPAHQVKFPDESFEVIISTECFEHDQFYVKTLWNAVRMLKRGGLLLFTCATTGRPEHGTTRTSPKDSPFTNDYYRNITEDDVKNALILDKEFSSHFLGTHKLDLRFWGVKA
jgi:SAM-dependent methyltransferase